MNTGRQLGSQIIAEFEARGGENANGVEVVSLLLGIEENNFDSSIRSFAKNTGFDFAGVDCVLEGGSRTAFREGFSYYTGLSPDRIPSTGLRRAVVVINGVTNSPSHIPWEILYNDNRYDSTRQGSLLALMDAVMSGMDGGNQMGLDYDAWAAFHELGEDAGPLTDSDGDGISNLLEFYFDTLPGVPNALPLFVTREPGDGALIMHFVAGKDRTGLNVEIEGSNDLRSWVPVEIPGSWSVQPEDGRDRITVALPVSAPEFVRLRVELLP